MGDFSPEQMISFCFSSSVELEDRINKLTSEFVSYSLKVKDGEPFSQRRHDSFLRMIDLLTKCKDRQYKFVNEFLNGK